MSRYENASMITADVAYDDDGNRYPTNFQWVGDSDYIVISNPLLLEILSTSLYGEGTRFNIGPYQLELTSDDLPFKDDAWVAKRVDSS